MTLKIVLLLFFTLLNITFALWVYSKKRKSPINRTYSIFMFCVGVWSLGLAMFYFVERAAQNIFWANFVYFMGSAIGVSFFHCSLVLTDEKKRNRTILLLPSISLIILFILYFLTPWMVKDVNFPQGIKTFIYGPLHLLFDLHFSGLFIAALVHLFLTLKKTSGQKKEQIKYILLSTFIGVAFNGLTNVTLPSLFYNCSWIWMGPHITFVMVSIMTYAILRYRILDINFVIRRGVANIVIAICLSAVFLPISLISILSLKLALLFLSVFLAAIYLPKIKLILDPAVTKILYKNKYDYLDELRDFTHSAMVFILEEHELLNEVAKKIYELMKVKEVRIYLREGTSTECVPKAGIGGKPERSPRPIEGMGECADVFIPEEQMMRPESLDTEISISVPIVLKGRDVLGYITLGSKTTGEMFTHLDLELLQRLGMRLGIVLDYKRMEKYLREHKSQENIVQMVMELSHQLHSRLTSVETHCRIVLNKAKENPILKQYEELSNLAIKDMNALFYKLRELAFFVNMDSPHPKETELGEIIQGAVELQEEKLKKVCIKLIRTESAHLTQIYCDGQLIAGAVGNILENAIWAVAEQEGRIEIASETLEKKTQAMKERCDTWVRISIEDNGPGLSEESMQKAFDPFYTTKNRGVEKHTSGFGLGLTVAKRIVETHGGTIAIRSKPGETIVTMDLPRKYKPLENAEKEKEKEKKEKPT